MDYSEVDDIALIQRSEDEPAAFGELYERHVKRIYNYIYYRTGNHHDAEDLTAKVFQRALKHAGGFVDKGVPVSAWLYRIAHNLVANFHRDRSRNPVVPLEHRTLISERGAYPEASAIQSEEIQLLLEHVHKLPEDRQQLLILKFVERLPNAVIGEIMGRTEGAIKSLYHRTLNSLRDDMIAYLAAKDAGPPKPLDGE